LHKRINGREELRFLIGDDKIKNTIHAVLGFFCGSPLNLAETECSRNYPTTTPTVPSSIDSVRASFNGGRANPFIGRMYPAGFSPAFHEFPTIDIALLFHDHATGGLKSRSSAATAFLLNDYRSPRNVTERCFYHFSSSEGMVIFRAWVKVRFHPVRAPAVGCSQVGVSYRLHDCSGNWDRLIFSFRFI